MEEKNDYIDNKKEKKRITRNILLVSFSFTLTFTAYMGLGNLQSSLHTDGGLGTISQTVLYVGFILGCLVLPKIMMNSFGQRWSMAIGQMGYLIWDAANGYAVWGTLVPASFICGLSAAPLYTAQASYFNILAERYAVVMRETKEAVVARFSGIFFFFFQISYATGSVISSTVLIPGDNNDSAIDDDRLEWCGMNDCPNNPYEDNVFKPSEDTVWMLVGILTGTAFIGVLIMCFLVENIPSDLLKSEKVTFKESLKFVVATVKQLKYRDQLLLIPITMYGGLQFASGTAEFTKSYVTCSVGIWKVGFVFIPYGLVNAAASLISGQLVKYTGRIPIFTAVFVLDLIKMIVLMTWMPHPDQEYVLYIMASIWGCCDGIWRTQNRALYGVLFSSALEAAFANFHMWESFGMMIAFGYSSIVCTSVKFYVTTAFMCVGMVLYYIVEYLHHKHSKVGPMTIPLEECNQKEHSTITKTVDSSKTSLEKY